MAWAAARRVRRMKSREAGPSAQTPIWEEPVRGSTPTPGSSWPCRGSTCFRSVLEGGLGPPVRYLFGLGLTAVEPGGRDVHHAGDRLAAVPQGVVSGAPSDPADAPLGCAVQTALPRLPRSPGAEKISLRFLRTVAPQSGTLTAKGRLIHVGQTTGVSLVEVTDQAGRLVAVNEHPGARSCRGSRCRGRFIEQALKNPPACGSRTGRTPHPYETAGGRRGAVAGDLGRHGTVSAFCSPSSPVTCRRPRSPTLSANHLP